MSATQSFGIKKEHLPAELAKLLLLRTITRLNSPLGKNVSNPVLSENSSGSADKMLLVIPNKFAANAIAVEEDMDRKIRRGDVPISLIASGKGSGRLLLVGSVFGDVMADCGIDVPTFTLFSELPSLSFISISSSLCS